MVSFPSLLIKAIRRPGKIGLCLRMCGQLWWVDRQLQTLAICALNDGALTGSTPSPLPPLSQKLQKEIDRRVALLSWLTRYHPCRPRCLHCSLVLYLWLIKHKIPARLEVGWGDNVGHAWVSYDGKILNDRPDVAQFTPKFIRAERT